MKKGSKIILFIAMTAITFGSLNYFIGRRHWDNGFHNHHGCGSEMRLDNAPQSPAPTKSV
jgi:hypothetical protein